MPSHGRGGGVSRWPAYAGGFFLLLLAVGGGYFAGQSGREEPGDREPAAGRVKVKPGPWGEMEYLPITIAAPVEMLKVRDYEQSPLYWHFRGMTRDGFARLLGELGVSRPVRERLLEPSVLTAHPEGLRLAPPCAAIRQLDGRTREGLFAELARNPANAPDRWEFLARYVDALGEQGVSGKTRSLVDAFSVPHDRFFVTYAMQCVFEGIPTHEEKAGLVKALTQQSSMLVRLKVTPRTDVRALAAYWGKALWDTDVQAILESIRRRPDGGSISLVELFPPLPASLLHGYPVPHNPMNGPEVVKNCSWTAFNFFRDAPDPAFADPRHVVEVLGRDYYPIHSDPRYGDVAVFLTPEQLMIHVATYVADDIYFTKNGDNPWHPWVLSTVADMRESLSFGLPEGRSLTLRHFRNKYL